MITKNPNTTFYPLKCWNLVPVWYPKWYPARNRVFVMSIFINKNDQLIDKNFFGRRVKYKLPKWVKLQRDKTQFIQDHQIIKRWLTNRGCHDFTGKEMQFVVIEYFEGTDDDKTNILKDGIYVAPRPEAKTTPLVDYIEEYQDHITKNATHKTKDLNLAYLDTWSIYANTQHPNRLKLEHIDIDLLYHFTNWRYDFRKPNCSRRGLVSDATIIKEVRELKKCLEWCYTKELCDHIPRIFQVKYKLPTRQIRKAVTPLDMDKQLLLLKHCRERETPVVHDLILFLMSTGMRIGELDVIDKSSFNLELGTLEIHSLSINNSISGGKTTSAPRVLPLTPTLIELYQRGHIFNDKRKVGNLRLKMRGKKSERLQSTLKRRKRHTPTEVFPEFDFDFEDFSFHQLRHSFVTNLLLAEEDVAKVSRMAGHASINITFDRYGKYANMGIPKQKERYGQFMMNLRENYFK